ncbi:Glycosyltransferase involved in cell wall bisynthesis [Clostridium cadaveris]|uniref:Glycosyltransferase involved in cell wall bisynthesis n=1 Tax=Clostridium cadaveris TaxID=1529 RepID=A0A1I2N803_9CLOT|nr:glycosyltransferase [Clostridium cadaveris]SFF98989.1 Glycosyltransferase involved in cell wall bisynthesis [Clostridium cadaveris]
MKRIIFVINNMHVGGTRKSLLSLLNELSNMENIHVDLLIMSHHGALMNEIPLGINVIKKDLVLQSLICKRSELDSIKEKIIRTIGAALQRIFGYDCCYPIIYKKCLKKLQLKQYDASFGFQEGPSNDLAFYVPSKKHYAWIHNDFDNFKFSKSNSGIAKIYSHFDKIIFVADASMQNFISNHVGLESNCEVIKNTLNTSSILKNASLQSEIEFMSNDLRLITVGRANKQKGYDRLINVAKELYYKGYSFEWIIVGGGNELEQLRESVRENKLEKCVRFCGENTNPYAIEKHADIYVMTSRYESQPLVLIEALILGLPVITTYFNSSKEVVGGLGCAIMCDNSEEGLLNALENIIKNKSKIIEMKKSAMDYNYTNEKYVKRILELC